MCRPTSVANLGKHWAEFWPQLVKIGPTLGEIGTCCRILPAFFFVTLGGLQSRTAAQGTTRAS